LGRDFALGFGLGRDAARFLGLGFDFGFGFGLGFGVFFFMGALFGPGPVTALFVSAAGAGGLAAGGRRSGGSVWIWRSRSSRLRRSASWSHSRSFCSSVAGGGGVAGCAVAVRGAVRFAASRRRSSARAD